MATVCLLRARSPQVQQRLANNRLMHDPQTRAYAARRTATGTSRKEILRLLKRYIARQVFPKSATRSAHQTPFPTTP